MNQIIFSGRLTKDPYVTTSQNGIKIAKFTVAVDKPVGKGKPKEADFLKTVAFDKLAALCEKHTAKGLRVNIVGSLHTGSYKNKEGQTIYTTETNAIIVEFVDWKKDEDAQTEGSADEDIPEEYQEVESEEVPF